MNRQTYRTYEPVSLSTAAPGWRAAYILDPDEGEPGWHAEPLIAWAVYKVTTRPFKGSAALEQSEGRQIHGVVFNGWAHAPEEADDFWRYLQPGDPDPSPDEVATEQARRAELAQKQAAKQ